MQVARNADSSQNVPELQELGSGLKRKRLRHERTLRLPVCELDYLGL
jgi:hypothetical protein